jgi:glycosyltransferase involved in cell wall biosynthesis
MRTVVIFQHRLLHYRVELFELLRARCLEKSIKLHLVHGAPTVREKVRNDVGYLPWADAVIGRCLQIADKDLIWLPLPSHLRAADLVVLMQENRQLSNYPLLLSRLWSARKVAYWGHGKNFQSDAPTGLREQWKNFLLRRVDWWFAYTQMTVDIVTKAGYPPSQITCLNNAIDTGAFKRDLASWASDDVTAARLQLGIATDASVGVFCGSLYLDKKLDLLVASADLIRERMPGFAVVVIGDGPSMQQMREAAATRPWLHLLGVRKGREKALYYRMADVILNPGAVGLHVVDAFCSGAVMVTTVTARHGPEAAYLKNGENGMLCNDTADAYSQAVISVLHDPLRLQRMKANALADSERYTLDNMVTRFVSGIEAAVRG